MTAGEDGSVGQGQLTASPSVRRWLDGAGYDQAPPAERAELLELLAGLCDVTGLQPDALVASCLRTTKAGDRTISAKGRREAEEAIERFVASRGLTGHPAIVAANRLRGFLIHNGIFMQGAASTG